VISRKLCLEKRFPTHIERKILRRINGETLDLGCSREFSFLLLRIYLLTIMLKE
jgi:hypothetical protein